jgi:DMSO/TMAO reductase YedYZ molybdopterin-dependent catalytic subunit
LPPRDAFAGKMGQGSPSGRFKPLRDEGPPPDDAFYREEVQLALRNRGMPLEALRYPVTPTGLHYLLTHFDIPYVDGADWSLFIRGRVQRSLQLSLAGIRSRPARTLTVTMECAGNGRALMQPRPVSQPWLVEAIGTAEWTGTPLRPLLEEVGILADAKEVLFHGLDKGVQGDEVQYYQRSLSLAEALRDEVLLAYEMNGEPLQPQHGFPLRLLVPGWYGMTSVKWLESIEVIDAPFDGYQMSRSYRYSQNAEDPGDPVDLIRVRALMVPPGVPDFLTRGRLVDAGPVTLQGRAWAGRLRVVRVEVSVDAGATWSDAALEPLLGDYAWRGWTFAWQAGPGKHELRVRATDEEGRAQPDEEWNYHGMGNNMAQRVQVLVE